MDNESICSQADSEYDMLESSPSTVVNITLSSEAAENIKEQNLPCCSDHGPRRPLNLLSLPVDVLREIVKEVTHTNDLTALALASSALHKLAIPHIYSRFDIVWPDSTNSSDAKAGVDALTYGLSTLVMSKDVLAFPEETHSSSSICQQCGHRTSVQERDEPNQFIARNRRRGNDYAKYCKKFSLGNGPDEWVSEYFINKESGKMLGTLAALALARMVNLESFVWDMASGIVRDVWDSLAMRDRGEPSRLQSIWVRCHDNKITSPSMATNPVPAHLWPASSLDESEYPLAYAQKSNPALLQSYARIENPSFSILPALKSITVLAIDELAYLEELSILVERSFKTLRELRVGVSQKWPGLKPPELPCQGHHAYLGNDGVLGVLLGKLMRRHGSYLHHNCPIQVTQRPVPRVSGTNVVLQSGKAQAEGGKALEHITVHEMKTEPTGNSESIPTTIDTAEAESIVCELVEQTVASSDFASKFRVHQDGSTSLGTHNTITKRGVTENKLSLDVLELERIPLGIKILREAVDWTKMTSLTLLNCEGDERLWKALKKTFSPQPNLAFARSSKTDLTPQEYPLKLKRIRTNNVSPTFISFLKDNLAADSLEWLFLHDNEETPSKVSLETIMKGPLRWHRRSLRKLMIDSSAGGRRNNKCKKWAFTREMLSFLTSGKMGNIRELAFNAQYKDWHFFLQQLPKIPHLRSLYIPLIVEHVYGSNIDTRELASQILDIVSLRPEIELCYMGLGTKCYEIFEANGKNEREGLPFLNHEESDTENEEEDDDLDDEHDSDDDGDGMQEADEDASTEEESEQNKDDADSDTSSNAGDSKESRLDFREILFYVEKVDIFRARHCRL